jgi:glucose-6-phosphate 1-epimerase
MARTTNIEALADRFDIPGTVTIEQRGSAGIVAIKTAAADATISLQGAQLLSWTPAGEADVLWTSPLAGIGNGLAIRGGIPICWPWFGPHPTDPAAPAHGFARNALWDLMSTETQGDTARIVFRLADTDLQRTFGPTAVDLSMTLSIGRDLDIALVTGNLGATPLSITEALHTYFQVGDVKLIEIAGLEGESYLDNADGGVRKTQKNNVVIDQEVVRAFDATAAPVTLTDPVLGRRITIGKSGSGATIVWNPWTRAGAGSFTDIPSGDFAKFVCIESGNTGRAALTLPPGARHTLTARYSVARL